MSRPNAEWRAHIPNGLINATIKDWHEKQPPRVQTVASPSTLTQCPRVVWLKKRGVAYTNEMGWGQKQRMMLGRITENLLAQQLKDEGKLLWHWADNYAGESTKFGMGEGMGRIEGTPDLLIQLGDTVVISDSKTSRADSFAYVPLDDSVWDDELWWHYKLQVECYYMLCWKNKDWFEDKVKADFSKIFPYSDTSNHLPLPQACHLFSYALDDGVVKREFMWKPSKETAAQILHYANRWNKAYASEETPDCQCTETQTKFCPMGYEFTTTRTGYKLATSCCKEDYDGN